MELKTGTLAREDLPPWAKGALAICLLFMVGIALWSPYEILGAHFERVSTVRRSIFLDPGPGRGFHRLRLKRLLLEEAVVVACAAIVLFSARRRGFRVDPGPGDS